MAGEENLTVREARRTVRCAEERGEGWGAVGLVGVVGRDEFSPEGDERGYNASMSDLASCRLISSVYGGWFGIVFADQNGRPGERTSSIVGWNVCLKIEWNTSLDGCEGGNTSGAAKVYAVRANKYGGGRLNSRMEGRGSGVA